MKNLRHILAGTAVSLLLPLSAWAGPVNVNTADAETISAELQGVGLTKANAIVEYREEHGPFRSAIDLAEVKGIGQPAKHGGIAQTLRWLPGSAAFHRILSNFARCQPGAGCLCSNIADQA